MMLYAPLKLSKLKICQPEEEGLFSIYLMIHMTDLNIFFEEKENIIPVYQTDKGKYLLI